MATVEDAIVATAAPIANNGDRQTTATDLAGLGRLWVPDDFSNECMGCQVPFRFSKWRYHCRVCGLLFCYECVKTKREIPAAFGYTGAQSCCRGCVEALEQKTIASPADVFARRQSSGKKPSNDENLDCYVGRMPKEAASAEATLGDDALSRTKESSPTYGSPDDLINGEATRTDHAQCHACFRPFELDHPQHPAGMSLPASPDSRVKMGALDETAVEVVSVVAVAVADCAECGRKISASDRFCAYCGTQVSVSLAQQKTQGKAAGLVSVAADCMKCGRKVSASDRFCVYCETKAGASLVQQTPAIKAAGLAGLDKFWVPDDFSNECMGCNAPFSFIKWRHHCRVCGLLLPSAEAVKKEHMENRTHGWPTVNTRARRVPNNRRTRRVAMWLFDCHVDPELVEEHIGWPSGWFRETLKLETK